MLSIWTSPNKLSFGKEFNPLQTDPPPHFYGPKENAFENIVGKSISLSANVLIMDIFLFVSLDAEMKKK